MKTAAAGIDKSPRAILLLAGFILVVVGIGIFIGTSNPPGEWYRNLGKPSFNPPNWVFGPVWTVLYVIIAIAGWRTFLRDRAGRTMKLWIAQMLLNWSWSPIWFTLHSLWGAFAVIVALWLTILAFMLQTRKTDITSAWLFVPYWLWVSFAALLNGSIAILN